MATYSRTVRRGLPRTRDGEPWPPAGDAPVEVADPAPAVVAGAEPPVVEQAEPPVVEQAERVETTPTVVAIEDVSARASGPRSTSGVALRRGLPRVAGGEPWPPAGVAVAVVSGQVADEPEAAPRAERTETTSEVTATGDVSSRAFGPRSTSGAALAGGMALRRGLPRTKGGEPWPPAGFAPAAETVAPAADAPEPAPAPTTPARAGRRTGLPRPGAAAAASAQPAPAASTPAAAPAAAPAQAAPAALAPLPFTSSVRAGEAAARWEADRARAIAKRKPITPPEPVRHGPFTTGQWVGAAIIAVIALVGAAGMLVMLTRWFLSLEFMQSFVASYPGAYELPEQAPVGFPVWLNWQHFLNIFFMVLIIRSGLYVRHQKRPAAFWSPRGNPKRKISIQLWLHQSLDILWLVNGVVFIVLLFSTGQWMRLVPTDWSVFPNALSAGLQYLSMDWPIEDGWVNYNSLQQLAYFAVVFLAAPLAAITGVRMSGVWPKNATALNKAYPIEWARAVHFPTMLFFVLFIVAHVTLVVTTGFLHNLNAMFASNPGNGWVGFWFFVGAMVLVVAGWVAARPLVLAPIAKLFGRVSER
ncbi:cytochrome b/b6 domain-containing protein [Microbacterium protaetiae]|uniref:Cytochrome b/b6 domain-containing protein n=1 Tax=Microbacterium protaetiae TaxID=2509458 RepID=A0A4P6EDK3_9MICO|nr:cytochrome b/b6 domain-containing protein [Microbacterium protaetiae]QAY59149.1 cytochrome b/b6 domain-containing protein [Microbacterium protaetiae]